MTGVAYLGTQRDFDGKAVGLEVGRRNRALTRFHTGFHDGKSKADTAGISVTRGFGTKKWLEQLIDVIFRNTWAMITDFNFHEAVYFPRGYFDRACISGIFYGISHQIRNGAGQKRPSCRTPGSHSHMA